MSVVWVKRGQPSEGLFARLGELVTFDAPRDWWVSELESGRLHVLEVYQGSTLRAWILYRFERIEAGRELVGVAALHTMAGEGLHVSRYGVPAFVEFGRRSRAASIRLHVLRKGMIRHAQKSGFQQAEIVMRKILE